MIIDTFCTLRFASHPFNGATSSCAFRARAVQQSAQLPCFWLRGLMPSHLCALDAEHKPPTELSVRYYGPEYPSWGSGTYYGDGSGGEFTSHPSIRRCGVGIAKINESNELVFAAAMNLPGIIQTVPRSEYFAFLYTVQLAEPLAHITFVTDHQKLKEIFDKGRIAAANCINYDLLLPVFDLIREKGLTVNMRWIPSHLDEEALPTNVSLCDFIGNRFADKYAKKAADQYSLPLHITAPILYHSNLIRRI